MNRVVCLIIFGLLLVLSSAVVSSQGRVETPRVGRTEHDMRLVGAPTQLTKAELAGRQLFVQRCAICHDPLSSAHTTARAAGTVPGPWLDQDTLQEEGETGVRQSIMQGSISMPGFQYALRPAQLDQLVAFLKTITPDQKPPVAEGGAP